MTATEFGKVKLISTQSSPNNCQRYRNFQFDEFATCHDVKSFCGIQRARVKFSCLQKCSIRTRMTNKIPFELSRHGPHEMSNKYGKVAEAESATGNGEWTTIDIQEQTMSEVCKVLRFDL